MSRIVITVDQVRDKTALLMHLRAVTGRSWADIQDRLRTRQPVIECILFNNDHENRARKLESVLDLKPTDAATFKVFELRPDEAFDSQHGRASAYYKVSDEEFAAISITPDRFHGDWNYTIHPTKHDG